MSKHCNHTKDRVKRSFDLIFSTLLLLIGLPFIVLLFLIISFDRIIRFDFGPLFIYEKRISKGQVFNLVKLNMYREQCRKNYIETSEKYQQWGTYSFLQQHQENLTPFGRIMKKIYLDELGQLVNILVGEMSFVGPRPLPVNFKNSLTAPRRKQKAGLVGFTATRFKNGKSVNALETDMEYLNLYNNSKVTELIKTDIGILYDAIRAVIKAKGL